MSIGSYLKDNKFCYSFSLFTVLVYTVLYFFSAKNNLVFGGDTIQYIDMANKFRNFEFPFSPRWVPFYSVFIGILSWTGIGFFTSALIINYIFAIGIIILLNYFISLFFKENKYAFLLVNVLLLFSREFYYNSLNIMAEIPMLFAFLLIITVFYKFYINKNYFTTNEIIILSLLSIFALFTKYNAIIIIITIFSFNILNPKQFNKLKISSIYILPIVSIYFTWVRFKPGEDMFGRYLTKNYVQNDNLLDNLIINLNLYFDTLIEFYFIPKFQNIIMEIFPDIVYSIITLLILISIGMFLLISFFKGNISKPYKFLLILILVNALAHIYAVSSRGSNEVNIRTLFYITFFLNMILFFLVFDKSNTKWIRFVSFSILVVFVFFNSFKMYQTFLRFYNVGYGKLSYSYVKNKNSFFYSSVDFIKTNNIDSKNIYSNQHKLLGAFVGLHELNEMPTNLQWFGIYQFYKDTSQIHIEIEEMHDLFNENKSIIIYYGNNYDDLFETFYKDYFKDYTCFFDEEGFYIYNSLESN